MNRFIPLYWKEGLFLRPHHLQYFNQYHESQLLYHTRILNKYLWGVNTLTINPEALQNGMIEVVQCELLLGEGALLTYPGNCEIERRNFESFLSPAEPLSVYLGTRKLRQGKPNVADSMEGKPKTRYITTSIEIADVNTGSNECAVELLQNNVAILFNGEEELLQDYDSIKIAEITETGKREPRFQISPDYIPPSLTISSSDVLYAYIRRVVDVLSAKSKVLSQETREKGLRISHYGVSDVMTHFLMHTINSFLPLVQHYVLAGGVSPYQMYSVLAQLYGALTSFSKDHEPWEIEPYDHHNCAPCVSITVRKIIEMLDAAISTRYLRVPLQFDGEFFTAELDPSLLETDNQYFLAVRGEMPVGQIAESFPARTKISSKQRMKELIHHALSGVNLNHVEEPPVEIPRQSNYSYFKLQSYGPEWDRVIHDKDIALYLVAEPERFSIDLFILQP